MATRVFETVEEIDRHYKRQIDGAEGDDLAVANLRAERAETIAGFREAESKTATHKATVAEVAAKFKIQDEFVSLLDRPDWSREQIEKHAELIAKAQTAPAPSTQEIYGGAPGGGAPPRQQSKDEGGDWLSDFEKRYNAGERMSTVEYQRYIQTRLGRHAARALKETGKKNVWDKVELPAWERV